MPGFITAKLMSWVSVGLVLALVGMWTWDSIKISNLNATLKETQDALEKKKSALAVCDAGNAALKARISEQNQAIAGLQAQNAALEAAAAKKASDAQKQSAKARQASAASYDTTAKGMTEWFAHTFSR